MAYLYVNYHHEITALATQPLQTYAASSGKQVVAFRCSAWSRSLLNASPSVRNYPEIMSRRRLRILDRNRAVVMLQADVPRIDVDTV